MIAQNRINQSTLNYYQLIFQSNLERLPASQQFTYLSLPHYCNVDTCINTLYKFKSEELRRVH